MEPKAPATRCSSRRYVLPPRALLTRNLAALWAVDADLARRVENTCADAVEILASRAGPATASIRTEAGPRLLHSRYDPVAEAKKLVERTPLQDATILFVNGFGLGHHVTQLLESTFAAINIYVFEPSLETIRAAVEHVDLEETFASGRVRIVTHTDRAKLLEQFSPLSAPVAAGLIEIDHAPSVAAWPAFFEATKANVEEVRSFCRTAVNTLVLNGRRTAENLINNLRTYLTTGSINRLADIARGKPAVVVAAGPSLRKNIAQLRAVRENVYIIAVQTTLKVLLEHGIEPDFVTSLDYHEISRRFFEHLPPGCRCELVAEPKATPAIFELHPGPVTTLGNEFADTLLHEIRTDKGRLRAGATVAHLAFYLAEHLGCDPILFVGQDLGFSDGLCYSPGTSYDDVWRSELGTFCTIEMKQWEQIARDRNVLRRVPDHAGRPMYTEQRLWAYLQQFERDFANSKRTIIDCTEGGVRKRGATPMPLSDALARHATTPINKQIPPQTPVDSNQLARAADLLRRRADEGRQIRLLAERTLPLLEEIRDHLDDQLRVNRLIAQIDALRREMNTFGRTYDLVMQLTQRSELERFKADTRISLAGVDGTERQRRQVERDIGNVTAVRDAASEFVRLIDRAAETFSNETESKPAKEAAA